MERQEKKKNIDGTKADEVQKTFLERLKLFFDLGTAKKNKNNSRLIKFNYGIRRSKNATQSPLKSKTTDKHDSLIDEPQKSFLEKVSVFFKSITWKKKKNLSLKKSSTTHERDVLADQPKIPKKEMQKQDKSLRIYIEQNCKWAILLLVIYIITFGAVVSGPILFNHFRVMNQNETEQERPIISRLPKVII